MTLAVLDAWSLGVLVRVLQRQRTNRMCVCVCVCVYTHTHSHTDVYIHTYIYTHTFGDGERERFKEFAHTIVGLASPKPAVQGPPWWSNG